MLTVGTKIVGTYVRIPEQMLDVTIPDWVYEIQILVDKPVSDSVALANLIKTEFSKRLPDVKIHWIFIDGDEVRIQITGSPTAWSLILSLLPLIFTLLGLTLIMVAIWGVISSIPSWAWALLIMGVALFWILPYIEIPAPPEKKEGKKTTPSYVT